MKIKTILAIAFIAMTFKAKSQTFLGTQLNATRITGYGIGLYGLGINSSFLFKKKHPISISYNYYLPFQKQYIDVFEPISSAPSGTPNYNRVTKEKLTFSNIFIGYNIHPKGIDETGVYFLGEGGLAFMTYTYHQPGLGANYGGSGGGFNIEEAIIGPYFGFGAGYQLILGNRSKIFFQGKLNSENFTWGDQTAVAPTSIPTSFTLNIGYQILLK